MTFIWTKIQELKHIQNLITPTHGFHQQQTKLHSDFKGLKKNVN
jgi:hypothetical protein